MKKVALSVNDNPDYLYYLPICYHAWKSFGWEPIICLVSDLNKDKIQKLYDLFSSFDVGELIIKKPFLNYRSDTFTQLSRIHFYNFIKDDDYIVIGDIDMIPLSDIWTPDIDNGKINIYGHDLTGYGDIPMCYIAAKGFQLREVFSNGYGEFYAEMTHDLLSFPKAKSETFDDYWYTDQKIATEKLFKKRTELNFIKRGQYPNGFAIGRVDRGKWSLNHESFIDSHLMRNAYKDQQSYDLNMALYTKIFGKEGSDWIEKYTNNFKEIYNEVF